MFLDAMSDAVRGYSLLITDARKDDNPIVYVNESFLRLTGYRHDEVIGRNCRFLQGPDSDPLAVQAMSDAIRRGVAVTVDILNYRKDATPFWNRVRIRPMLDDDGAVTNFLGLQAPVPPGEVEALEG